MRNDYLEFYEQTLALTHPQDLATCRLGFASSDLQKLKVIAANFLHPEEITKLQTLKYEKRQFSFLLGRYCCKKVVANFNKLTELTSFQIKSGVFQQPFLQGSTVGTTQISVSHCDTITTTIAFPANMIMGIDIEQIKPNYQAALLSQMQENELALLANIFGEQQNLVGLTLFWTIKEALSKALKTGLTISMDLLAINKIENNAEYWISSFQNFSQYQAISFSVKDIIFSLVFPKNYSLDINIDEIKLWLLTQLNTD